MSDDRVFAKCAWRLMPLIVVAYLANYLDRTNIGFAALTMNKDLGFSPSVYGLGAGIFFLSYSLFQVPANIMMHRVGARRWIFLLLMSWGAAAAVSALIANAWSYYGLRFLLGTAEAGFFPAIILYLTLWFPKAYLGRVTAMFMSAATASQIIGGPAASLILRMDGIASIHGWQWLFLLEGLPACIMGFLVLRLLPDGPEHASWLNNGEKDFIASRIQTESRAKDHNLLRALLDVRVLLLGVAYSGLLLAIYGMNFWLPLLVQGMGFSNTANGFVVALVYTAAVPAMVFWGRSSDRKGERIWHTAIAALFAAAALALASATQNDLVRLLAISAAEIGLTAMLAPFYSLPALFLSGPAMAGGFALFSAIGNLLGGFAGQYLIGAIRQEMGGYTAVLAAMAVALLTAGIIVLALGRSLAPRSAAAMTKANAAE